MKFPVPGDYVPQSVGSDVWDPYVLNMVYNELIDVYHFSQSQIDDGGYTIRTTIDDAKMKALYQAVIENEAQIDASGVPLDPTYMHAGAVLEDPASGDIQALYPGRATRVRSTTGPARSLPRATARRLPAKSTWRCTTASRSVPRSSRTSCRSRSSSA